MHRASSAVAGTIRRRKIDDWGRLFFCVTRSVDAVRLPRTLKFADLTSLVPFSTATGVYTNYFPSTTFRPTQSIPTARLRLRTPTARENSISILSPRPPPAAVRQHPENSALALPPCPVVAGPARL